MNIRPFLVTLLLASCTMPVGEGRQIGLYEAHSSKGMAIQATWSIGKPEEELTRVVGIAFNTETGVQIIDDLMQDQHDAWRKR